jgi:Ohr subfamily peroxiredoxin
MQVNPLYTGHATASGGRNGHTQSSDGVVSVGLSLPKALGGQGRAGTTTPEDLFAAGYAACFGSACDTMAQKLRLAPGSIVVSAAVGIGPAASGGFGLTVDLDVEVSGLSTSDAERLVAAGHSICPYSNAIKGNVEVRIATRVAALV